MKSNHNEDSGSKLFTAVSFLKVLMPRISKSKSPSTETPQLDVSGTRKPKGPSRPNENV